MMGYTPRIHCRQIRSQALIQWRSLQGLLNNQAWLLKHQNCAKHQNHEAAIHRSQDLFLPVIHMSCFAS